MVKFVGRDKALATLHEQLQQTEKVAISSISGMGGIGKTELALQYARYHWQKGTYPGGVCWLRGRDEDVVLQFLSFAKVHLELILPDDLSVEEKISFCWSKWPIPPNPPLEGDKESFPHSTKSAATSGFPLSKGDGRGIKPGDGRGIKSGDGSKQSIPPNPPLEGGNKESLRLSKGDGRGISSNVLIIFDDVAEYEQIANLLPSNPRFKVLVTT
ncbi:MAG: ATP-binding protein, partial [Okeania sp. SIO2D1]|nr:ATP-binding protein [Okeania sp. SIO2D1]